jgi:nucleoside-diphosphate-sugar epimerase
MMQDLKNKRIVVTGATGFIGSHIAKRLKELGADVVDTRDDILDTELMKKVFTGAWAVVHQAGLPPIPLSVKDPLASHKANVTGTLSVLVAARDAGVDRLLYASTTTIYGNNKTLPKVETLMPEPCSPYSLQKYECELNAKLFYELYGLKSIGLRYSNVYGPGQNAKANYVPVTTRFIDLMKSGKRPQIFGDGKQVRDFIYIDDVVEANIKALESDVSFGVYNIGSGEGISILQLVEKINAGLEINLEPEFFPLRAGDSPEDTILDIHKAKDDLGYVPKVMFDEGLKKTIDATKI